MIQKRQKEFVKQEKDSQRKEKEEAKQRKRKEKEEARQRKSQEKSRKPRQPRRPRQNYYQSPQNCEDIFIREGIIDSGFPPYITPEIKESIKQKWRKWTIVNHPDKKQGLSQEDYLKQTELFKEITGCKDLIIENKYVQDQGVQCNVM